METIASFIFPKYNPKALQKVRRKNLTFLFDNLRFNVIIKSKEKWQMAEEFVSKIEFNLLKEEVNEIKQENAENQKLLQAIDKKLDVIAEKINNSEKVENLRIETIEKKIKKIEDSQDWLWKTVVGTIIGVVIKLIFDVSKLL